MAIKLYLIEKEEIALHKEEILLLVDEERRKKALRYDKEDDVLRSLGVGYLYHKILGKTPSYDAKGRPFFENGPFISLAHSGHYSLLGVSDVPLGVDIEELRTFPSSPKKFFGVLESDEYYYASWCRYEAFAKCVGLGLAFPLSRSLPNGENFEYKGKKYSLTVTHFDKHIIASCVEGEKQEAEIIPQHFEMP